MLWLFAGLAGVAGFLLFPLAEETDRFFSWTIQPPLTAAFMGAAYWAAFVLIGWAARAASWEVARPTLVPVIDDRGAAAGRHADPPRQVRPRLDLRLVLAGRLLRGATCAGACWCGRRSAGRPAPPPPGPPDTRAAACRAAAPRRWSWAGSARVMYVEPSTAEDLWPWALTPLTARAVSAFLIGFAAAAAYAAADNRLERFAGRGLRVRDAGSARAAGGRASSRVTSTAGRARRSTSRSPPRCWPSERPAHSPCAARSAASACSRS